MPESSEQEPQVHPELRVTASLSAKLNLADFQNAVPALRELTVVNDTDFVREHLVIKASSDPSFFTPRQWRIDAIGPRQTRHVSQLDLQLDGPLLARLTEAEFARVRFDLAFSDTPESVVSTYAANVELLPRNHWGGLLHMPDMVAAFVQPNDPAVDKLLKKAAQILREKNWNPSLNGYESGSKHAWEILAAIWVAVAGTNLDYALPPSSFEQTGQKVRSPGQIIGSGIATCLDLTLLFASAAEQAGLNPLVVFTTGHALAGCWLRPEEFATSVVDDPSALRKRLLLKELVLFETTATTTRSVPPFTRACEIGSKLLAEDAPARFEAAVDIRRARLHKVKPLASADAALSTTDEVRVEVASPPIALEAPPDFPEELTGAPAEPDLRSLTPADRVARWQRKLLDLSLRNSLLNFRSKKRSVTFDAPAPGKLEDILASGKALRLLPRPDLMDGSDPRSRSLYEVQTHEDIRRQYALDGLEKGEIYSTIGEKELASTLVELYRSARTSLEEGGANTLFLALGFLVWTQEGKDQRKYRAPLVLIPVTLNRRSVRSGFTLTLHEDEPQFNPTLVEMLHQDFQMHVGIPEGDLPKDDSGLDVAGIWSRVSEAIKDVRDWEVATDVVLSTFSFAKHLMWKDLVHRTDQLRENPVVRHLIDTPREAYSSEIRFVEPKELDREFGPTETFCPLAADSSQLAAIMSAARGKDFVLIGPPGTGKSQTISNLIAHSIASGKRVLFVAEKIAALEVVYRRLQKQGLGQFCLEIHSSKAKKAEVLNALGAAWNSRGTATPEDWEAEANRLQDLRGRLNSYVAQLHQRRPNGLTAHRALGHAVAGHDVPQIGFPWPDPTGHDSEKLEVFRRTVARLGVCAEAFGVGNLNGTTLAAVGQTQWSPLWQEEFMTSVLKTKSTAQSFSDSYRRLSEITGLPSNILLTAANRAAIVELARVLPSCVGRAWAFVVMGDSSVVQDFRSGIALLTEHHSISGRIDEPWTTNIIAACREAIALLEQRDALRNSLPAPWPDTLRGKLEHGISLLHQIETEENRLSARYVMSRVKASVWEDNWRKAEKSIWPASALGKRRVRAALTSAVEEGCQPDPEKDLPILKRLEQMRMEVVSIDLRALPSGIWSGLQTSTETAEAALRLQKGLDSVCNGGQWVPVNLDLVASGLCGAVLKDTLESMLRLIDVDTRLGRFTWLSEPTAGLWAGTCSNKDSLIQAVRFCEAWHSGQLGGEHDAVVRGACGAHLRIQHGLLLRRAQLRQQIGNYDHLAVKSDGLWRGLDTDLGEFDLAVEFGAVMDRTIPAITATVDDALAIRMGIARLCRPGVSAELVRQASDSLAAACMSFTEALHKAVRLGRYLPEHQSRIENAEPEELIRHCDAVISSGPRLQRWCSWLQAREEAGRHGLDGFAMAIEQGTIGPAHLSDAFETNYCRWWLNHLVTGNELLRTFVSVQHEKQIAEFQAVDGHYTELTRDWIRAKLCASVPGAESPGLSPEWGTLRHELTKKKKHLPLRDLMGRIPSVITTLTPCLLMSPLSIAQYLAVSTASFDLVVFDEASQITVWDAIGAIARAKQVVMVGDPKQLPPTNFFDRSDDESEYSEDVPEDMESILDECIGASLPSIQLSWHYRSRHESLIAFSNRQYYGGNLITFPSPVTEDRAVRFHYVRGTYEKGGARTNITEARTVVQDIVGRLRSKGFDGLGYSIGVVTFNAEQQRLIEDLLDEERRRDPSIETYFDRERNEPVFVKNLESVQGDERDIMYFSITYGPDDAGKLSMNFGPMNRDGGERRLNVAITRARRELHVFSSLRPEQIDLSRTRATGVSEFKHFLEFAERGPRAFAEIVTGSTGDFESPFEQHVASALDSRNWTIHTQVGASGFRIDLGVVHPDAPGIYLAGIECDGATYHRSATARDRDKLRHQVLRDLGWEILRIWSTDWWIDRETTLSSVDAQLHSILEQSRRKRSATTPTAPSVLSEPAPVDLPQDTPATQAVTGAMQYKDNQGEFQTPLPSIGADPAQFFERSYDEELSRMVTEIIEQEGPILDEVLARRIARLHGWQRTGTRILERVNRVASKVGLKTKEDVGTFFWSQDHVDGEAIVFRAGLGRSVDEICMQELVALATEVIRKGQSGEEAVIEMAKAVGLQRLRTASRQRLLSALNRALQIHQD